MRQLLIANTRYRSSGGVVVIVCERMGHSRHVRGVSVGNCFRINTAVFDYRGHVTAADAMAGKGGFVHTLVSDTTALPVDDSSRDRALSHKRCPWQHGRLLSGSSRRVSAAAANGYGSPSVSGSSRIRSMLSSSS